MRKFFKKINKENIITFLKMHHVIILIIATSFFVRWFGIYFDYPYGVESIGDESNTMRYIMDVVEDKSFFKGAYSSYPILMAYFYFPVLILRILYLALINGLHNIAEIKGYLIGNGIGQIYIIARWFSVVVGTSSVFLIYKIFKIIFKNKLSHYYATLAYSFSLIPILLSHWGRMYMPMSFFLLLSLFFALKFELEKRERYFFWAVLASGLSFSTHYIGIISFLFPLLNFIFNRKGITGKTILKSLLACIALFCFSLLVNFNGIKLMILSQYEFHQGTGFSGMFTVGKFERFYYFLLDIFKLEPVYFVLFVIVLIFNFRSYLKNNLIRYILAGLIINYILLLGIAGAHLSRWLLVFISLSTPLAAASFAEFLNKRNIKKILVYLTLFLLLFPSIFFSLHWAVLLRDNTRQEAIRWAKDNVKDGEFMYVFDNWLDAPLSYEAIAWDKQFNPRYSKKNDYILQHPEIIKNTQRVNLVYDFNQERFKELAGNKTKYVLFHYWQSGDKKDYYEFPTRKIVNNWIEEVKKNHKIELVKTFYPTKNVKLIKNGVDDYLNSPHSWLDLLYLEKSGPFIEIYKVLR